MENKSKQPEIRFPNFSGEWKFKKIGELTKRLSFPIDVQSNELYHQIGIRSHGKGIFYKEPVDGKALGNKRVFWVQPNCFIVNIVFAWEQAIAKTTDNESGMIASHRFPMYMPLVEEANLDYLLYFFMTRKGKSLLELASPGGAGRNKTLGQKEFENLKFLIPEKSEQTKISGFIELIEIRLITLTKKKNILTQYKRSLLQSIFSQKLRFTDDAANELDQWSEKALFQLGKTFNGLTGKTKEDFGTGKPYIQYKQVFGSSKIDTTKSYFVEVHESEKQNAVKYGDVFFTTSSETLGEIGYSSVLLNEVDEMYLNSFCFGYRIKSFDELYPNFAQYLFRSPSFRKSVIKLGQGSTRYNMSKTEFLKIKVSLPSLKEQIKISNFLNAVDTKIDYVTDQINCMMHYKNVLMQKMFV